MYNSGFDRALAVLQGWILSILKRLGIFAVAAMPATFTSVAVYILLLNSPTPELALPISIIVGFALETVGIVIVHIAAELYNGMRDGKIAPAKFKLLAGLVPVYGLLVSLIVWFSESAFSDLVRAIGIASPWLAIIIYIAIALANDLETILGREARIERRELDLQESERRRQQRLEDDELAHRREMERLRLTQDHELSLRQLTAQASVADDKRQRDDVDYDAIRQTLYNLLREGNNVSPTRFGEEHGVSRQTVHAWINKYQENGHG